jgi:hypothetical protein
MALQGIVQGVAWNPNPSLHIVAAVCDKKSVTLSSPFPCSLLSYRDMYCSLCLLSRHRLVFVSTGTGGAAHSAATLAVLQAAVPRKCKWRCWRCCSTVSTVASLAAVVARVQHANASSPLRTASRRMTTLTRRRTRSR